MNQSQKAQAERPGRAARCHTWAAGLYFKCCVANICRMNSKLGEGEGAGWRRCSKLGAELRQGWLLGADGGRAGAGACASCAAAALRLWGAQPRDGGSWGARLPRGGWRAEEPRWPGRDARTPRAAASYAEVAQTRPLVPLGTAPGTQITPKTPQSLAWQLALHPLAFPRQEGEGHGETLLAHRQPSAPIKLA